MEYFNLKGSLWLENSVGEFPLRGPFWYPLYGFVVFSGSISKLSCNFNQGSDSIWHAVWGIDTFKAMW